MGVQRVDDKHMGSGRIALGPVVVDPGCRTLDSFQRIGKPQRLTANLGPDAVGEVLSQLENDTLTPQVQDESQATKAPKMSKADGTVDFAMDAAAVAARVHGLTPWPGCRVMWQCRATGETSRLILHRVQVCETDSQAASDDRTLASPGEVLEGLEVQTAQGVVRLLEVQAAGTKVMAAEAFACGHKLAAGDRLSPITE